MSQVVIHFAHANGFAATTYRYLFELMPQVEVHYVEALGHGRHRLNGDWHNLADEVIESVERCGKAPVVGVGHSLGAVVTLMAAAKRPDLFSKVVLLDPVLFARRKRWLIGLMRTLGLGDRVGPIRRTLVRKWQFDSHDEAHRYFSDKSLFKDFHPRCFDDFVKHGLKPGNQGLELVFSPQVEAEIFRTLPIILPKTFAKVNGCVLYGSRSDILKSVDLRWWRKHLPQFEMIPIDGGHLFVQENPQQTAKVLFDCICR